MIKYKKASHVGIVLSFVMFVGFLIFLYTIIEPTLTVQKNKQTVMDNLKISLIEKFSSRLTIFTVVINDSITQNCFELEDFLDYSGSNNILVKNESRGIVRNTNISSGDNLQIERYLNSNTFFKIYHSEEFTPVNTASSACILLNNETYSIESKVKRDEIFIQKINQTLNEYVSNYDNLKTELKIPIENEFGFSFTDKNSIKIETPKVNTSTSIYAGEISVLFVDEEANINPGFVIIRVW